MKKVVQGIGFVMLIVGIFMSHYTATDEQAPMTMIMPLAPQYALQRPLLEGHDWEWGDLIGLEDVIFQTDGETSSEAGLPISDTDIGRLVDFNYLRTQFYIADRRTRLLSGDVDANSAMEIDFTVDIRNSEPKVLIFHTHSTEMFVDSDRNNVMDGVVGLGALLADILETQYGIPTLHVTTRFDFVDGVPRILGSYERMEEPIQQILRDNPSIEVVIDLHRDGLPEGAPPLVTYINGERTARIMFVNGLSRWYNSAGVLETVSWLPNPHVSDNLAFSFQLQMAANQRFPQWARRPYLKPFRYSLHLAPRTILVEIGAQNNTMQEARNAIPHLATIIADVILP